MRVGEEQKLVSGCSYRRVERRRLSAWLIATNDVHVGSVTVFVANDVRAPRVDTDNDLDVVRATYCAQAVLDPRPDRLDVVARGDDDRDRRRGTITRAALLPSAAATSRGETCNESGINHPYAEN